MDKDLKPLIRPARVPFKDLSAQDKVLFVAKLAICILTFGFAFPNVGD